MFYKTECHKSWLDRKSDIDALRLECRCALEKEKNIRLAEQLDTTKKTLDSLLAEVMENSLEYQRWRESEQNNFKEMQEDLLKERQRNYQLSQAVDEAKRQLAYEREQYKAALDKEKSLNIKLKNQIEIIKSQSQLQRMENKLDQTYIDHSRSNINVRDFTERNLQLDLKVLEEDREKLKKKINYLEHELGRIQTKMEELETDLEKARLVKENFHVELQSDEHCWYTVDDNVEQRLADCYLKLQSVAHQLNNMTLTSHQTISPFIQFQNTLVTVMSQLRQLRGEIKERCKAASGTCRLYDKFLRAESFRKALIYQKKYLLLLLGGYRDTEQETLAILASLGGFADPYRSSFRRNRSAAFTRFRAAGRLIIAISRMKYMVRKWKRATRVGSPVMTGHISPHTSYVPSSSSYPKHSLNLVGHKDLMCASNKTKCYPPF